MLMILSCWIVFILLLIYTFYYLTYVAFPLPPTLLISTLFQSFYITTSIWAGLL